MTFWNWLFGGDAMPGTDQACVSPMDINPATGLPMIDGSGGLDVGGSPFGVDVNFHSADHQPMADLDFGSSSGFDGDWPN
jgi:hypothetical protein